MTSTPISGYESAPDPGEFGTRATPEFETNAAPTSEVAKDQAANVADSAKESGKQVASTAAREASNVADEARRQAKDLGHEFSSQAQEQAAAQKDKAASGLHSLGHELRSMATQGGQSGPVTDLTHQAADKVTDLATWLEHRDLGSLLDEVRTYARRKPGTFLLGAVVAGVVAGRLTRGAVQASRDDNGDSGDSGHRAAATSVEATPIADLTAAETARNGYEAAGRSL
jgi:hypothetical protein